MSKKPRSGYAYHGRADAYRVNSEYNKAIADYNRAIELMPKEPRLYIGRGISYQLTGETGLADADFNHALALADKLHLKRQAEEQLKNLYAA